MTVVGISWRLRIEGASMGGTERHSLLDKVARRKKEERGSSRWKSIEEVFGVKRRANGLWRRSNGSHWWNSDSDTAVLLDLGDKAGPPGLTLGVEWRLAFL